MKFGLKDTGISYNEIHSLDDAVHALKQLNADLNATPVPIPRMFYGTLHELVDMGILEAPRNLDAKGRIIPSQKGQLLRKDGEVAYLYIPDMGNAYKSQDDRNRVHMYWCGTLSRMWNENREERYWGTIDTRGLFNMENGARVPLSVCKNCYDDFVTDKARYGTPEHFNFALFSSDNSNASKNDFATPSASGGLLWNCCKCNVEITHADDVIVSGGATWCMECHHTEQRFYVLRNAKNVSDLDVWFKNGGSVDLRDKTGIDALLYLAIYNPNPDLFDAIVRKYGANINTMDNKRKNALMHLIDKKCQISKMAEQYNYMLPAIECLIKLGINLEHTTKTQDGRDKTAIGHTANREIKQYLTEVLRKKGVAVN